MKMITRLVCLISAAAAVLPMQNAFAKEEGTVKKFTVDEAVEYMLENSLAVKADEESLKSYEMSRKAKILLRYRVNDTYAAYKVTAPGVDDMDTFLLTSGYVNYYNDAMVTIAKRTLSETKYQLTVKLENKYYSCLNADKKVKVALDALDNALENKQHADMKKEQGVIGAIEAQSFELALISAQNDYDDAVRSRDYMYCELKQLMSYPDDKEIVLTGEFQRQPMDQTPLAQALDGLDKTANKLNLDISLALQNELTKTYKSMYTTSMYEYQEQKYAYAKAEAEYNDNICNLRLALRDSYNTMVSTYGKLDYIDKAIDLKEQQADAQKTSYELGLSTASQYLTSVQELNELKLSRVDAEIGAYLTSRAYQILYHESEIQN